MTTLYFTALVVTYLANAIYFATKFVAHSSAREASRKNNASNLQARCCN